MVNQLVQLMAKGEDGNAKVVSGAVMMIDWILGGESFKGDAMRVLGLLDLDKEPYQDYMSRDSDTQELRS